MADVPDKGGIGGALARLPSGLFILTGGRGDEATGMLASFVQQVGFEPPCVVVALHKDRHLREQVSRDGVFCLSVLDEASRSLLGHFARGFDPEERAFEGVDVAVGSLGIPFPTAAHAVLECEVVGEADWTDHIVFCGRVVAGTCRGDATPLVHIRKNGFSY